MSVRAPEFLIPRDHASERLERFEASREPGERRGWLSRKPLYPGQLVLLQGELPEGTGPGPQGAWVGFIDEGPDRNWAHECTYWFLGPDGRSHHVAARWYPRHLRELFLPLGL